jgi:hypothetical protein
VHFVDVDVHKINALAGVVPVSSFKRELEKESKREREGEKERERERQRKRHREKIELI